MRELRLNYFAITVTVLQVLAAAAYALRGEWNDAGIWFLYAMINILLITR